MDELTLYKVRSAVREAISNGNSLEVIADYMRKDGYSEQEIDEAFAPFKQGASLSQTEFRKELDETKKDWKKQEIAEVQEKKTYSLSLGFKPLILAIIILNTIVFAYEMSLSPSELNYLVHDYGVSADNWMQKPYVLLTNAFLHADPLHLIMNMLVLFVLGCMLEDLLGELKLIFVYLGMAVFSALFFALSGSLFGIPASVPAIGASGAIFGIIGIGLVLKPLARIPILLVPLIGQLISPFMIYQAWKIRVPYLIFGIAYIFFQFIPALIFGSGGVAENAHFGGILFGLILGLTMGPSLKSKGFKDAGASFSENATIPSQYKQKHRINPFIIAGLLSVALLGVIFLLLPAAVEKVDYVSGYIACEYSMQVNYGGERLDAKGTKKIDKLNRKMRDTMTISHPSLNLEMDTRFNGIKFYIYEKLYVAGMGEQSDWYVADPSDPSVLSAEDMQEINTMMSLSPEEIEQKLRGSSSDAIVPFGMTLNSFSATCNYVKTIAASEFELPPGETAIPYTPQDSSLY